MHFFYKKKIETFLKNSYQNALNFLECLETIFKKYKIIFRYKNMFDIFKKTCYKGRYFLRIYLNYFLLFDRII